MKEAIFNQKFGNLSTFPILKEEVLKKAEGVIRNSEDLNLTRINPLAFAAKHDLGEDETVDFFVHATKVGLFDFAYNLLCPLCGGIVHTHYKLDQIQSKDFHCVVCNFVVPTLLDDQVEVSFELHPSLYENNVDPFASLEEYYDYYFSKNYVKSEQLISWIRKTIRKFAVLKPDEKFEFDIDLVLGEDMGEILQIVSINRNAAAFFKADKNAEPIDSHIYVDLLDSGFLPSEKSLKPGKYHITVQNRSHAIAGIQALTPNSEILQSIYKKFPTKITPFLTAKMLLNNQSFRELFRIHKLSPDLNLNVKSLTIMFTDLRGSTEMYDQAGDILAYRLVQEHFQLLTDTVREYKGAIVKTMGDAIMATFSTPIEGLLASLEMLKKIEGMNLAWKNEGYEIGLKVGLNEGSALAVVNDERLDYFGQSINIAARVQGLASSGEIWISESVWNAPGTQAEVIKSGFQSERLSARLKGVGTPATVFKLMPASLT
ncbi:adenylate/guanylate cyclase domain-containing protein [Leptospira ognonensis]|uniref:Adenylate/guanylate cyclase domain-containing protein n=1 Tax=Leptospira ognonensis TaxID=2484945 RepID=A0A4R9K2I8_9LEPT|nr:adenylate/guanylate cyclase domain-containing protein [Leptospira ognonensis]TGL60219.1 adenylate/guanylate cyclase domain-containing protein [Leptospira ognonensis]